MKNPIKKARKTAGKAAKKESRQIGKSIKRGTKAVAKGLKQYGKARGSQSKQTAKGKSVSTRSRTRANDAIVKIKSGTKVAASPAPGKKPKKKAYRTTPNINASAPGQKKYLTNKGKQTNRKGGRA